MYVSDKQVKTGRQILIIFLLFIAALEVFGQTARKVVVRIDSSFMVIETTDENDSKVVCTWDPNSEPDLSGYHVFIGTESGDYGFFLNVPKPITKQEFWELEKGTEYFFAVTAYDTSNNFSGFSEEVSIVISGLDQEAPIPPTGLAVGEIIDEQTLEEAFKEFLKRHEFKIIPLTAVE